jgi:hypothetical protein
VQQPLGGYQWRVIATFAVNIGRHIIGGKNPGYCSLIPIIYDIKLEVFTQSGKKCAELSCILFQKEQPETVPAEHLNSKLQRVPIPGLKIGHVGNSLLEGDFAWRIQQWIGMIGGLQVPMITPYSEGVQVMYVMGICSVSRMTQANQDLGTRQHLVYPAKNRFDLLSVSATYVGRGSLK